MSKLDTFLKQNHQIVQDFLKTTHEAVSAMANPVASREDTTESGQVLLEHAATIQQD